MLARLRDLQEQEGALHCCGIGLATYVRPVQVRDQLEAVVAVQDASDPNGPVPEYVECLIKELLRRYPATGNLTVRTPHSSPLELMDGEYTVPPGTPVFLHMYSHHNSSRHWKKAKEFLPERWMAGNASYSAPTCPFLASLGENQRGNASLSDTYEGLGFEDGALSYFPFSAGDRKCLGKGLALEVLRKYLMTIAGRFRLIPSNDIFEEDPGKSLDSTIIPLDPRSTRLLVKRVVIPVNGQANQASEEGWADEDD